MVNQRCDARVHADHIRVEPEGAGDVLIDVGVRVDHPWQHELARDVDDIGCCRAGNLCLHGCDAAIPDGDVK